MNGKARAFLARIVAGTFDDHPAVGLGRDVGVVGEGLVAGALVADDTVVHLTAFAEPVRHRADPSRDESPGRRYATCRQRRDSLRNRYGRQGEARETKPRDAGNSAAAARVGDSPGPPAVCYDCTIAPPFPPLQPPIAMAHDTIFAKIVRGDIPADIVHQDDLVTAFRDIRPLAPTHILIVPNEAIPTLADVSADHEPVLGRMLRVAADLAAKEGIAQGGYRVMINCRDHGGQEVYHLHLHLLGGRPLGRMLGR